MPELSGLPGNGQLDGVLPTVHRDGSVHDFHGPQRTDDTQVGGGAGAPVVAESASVEVRASDDQEIDRDGPGSQLVVHESALAVAGRSDQASASGGRSTSDRHDAALGSALAKATGSREQVIVLATSAVALRVSEVSGVPLGNEISAKSKVILVAESTTHVEKALRFSKQRPGQVLAVVAWRLPELALTKLLSALHVPNVVVGLPKDYYALVTPMPASRRTALLNEATALARIEAELASIPTQKG